MRLENDAESKSAREVRALGCAIDVGLPRRRRERTYIIAARAVAPNRVAPTVAVASDTSANAISSFIAFIPSSKRFHTVYAEVAPNIRYKGNSRD